MEKPKARSALGVEIGRCIPGEEGTEFGERIKPEALIGNGLSSNWSKVGIDTDRLSGDSLGIVCGDTTAAGLLLPSFMEENGTKDMDGNNESGSFKDNCPPGSTITLRLTLPSTRSGRIILPCSTSLCMALWISSPAVMSGLIKTRVFCRFWFQRVKKPAKVLLLLLAALDWSVGGIMAGSGTGTTVGEVTVAVG